jgi:hypothetical protein
MIFRYTLILSAYLLYGCQNQKENSHTSDLNSVKADFLQTILNGELGESPFQMHYELKTVFFSQDIVSLFGEMHVDDHLPHGSSRYEGKTFCRIRGKLEEIALNDIFVTKEQREFLRKYCEENLRRNPISYFSGEKPLRARLEYEDLHAFVVDDRSLIIFFQPYAVGGLSDGPLHVRIPYEHCEIPHPLFALLRQALSSRSYTILEHAFYD